MFYNARYYSPLLSRFVSADTIVPEPGNPQALNRYMYVLGNPLKFTDPSGYFTEGEIDKYLQNEYNDKWWAYKLAWQTDEVFWNMLLGSTYGDWLAAPTAPQLGTGFFAKHEGSNTFYFSHESGKSLRDYQGNGPYSINGNLTAKLSIHPSSSQDPIRMHWVQPLFDYSGDIPRWTGLFRHVNYSFSGSNFNWGAGGNTPYLLGAAVGALTSDYLVKRFTAMALLGPAGQVAAVGVALYDFGTYVDNALTINWELTVRVTSSRNNPIPVAPKRDCYTSVWCGPR